MFLGPLRSQSGASPLATTALLTLALLGQGATFEFNDALTVMLDGLSGQHAALVVFQFAVQFLGQLACRSHHHVEGLLRMTWAWQAEEEAHRRSAEVVDVVQIKDARLDRIGHGEQHFAVTRHAFVAMENIHLAKTQATFQNVLQQRRAFEAGGVAANHADHQHFFGLRLIFFADRWRGLGVIREIVVTAAEARAAVQVEAEVHVTLGRFAMATLAALGARLTRFPGRHAHGRQIVLIQLRLLMSIQHPWRAQQLGAGVLVRQVGQTSVKAEFKFSLAASHATPAIEKNTGNDNNADDDQPLAQTDFHVIPCLYKKCWKIRGLQLANRFKTWRQLYVL